MLFVRFFIHTILLFTMALVPGVSAAQLFKRTAVTSYTIEDGLLQNSVASMAVDGFGFAWFSTGAGIQRFDGTHFEMVQGRRSNGGFMTAAGLNLLQSGEIWISDAQGLIGIDPRTNRQRTIYAKPPRTAYFYKYAGEDQNTVWYIAYNDAFLQFDKRSGQLLTTAPFPASFETNGYPFFCRQIDGNTIAIRFRQSLAVFSLAQKKFVFTHHTPEPVTGFLPLKNHQLLFTMSGSFYRVDTRTGKSTFLKKAEAATPTSSFEMLLTRDGNLLTSYEKNIYELDTATFELKTKWAAFNQDNLLNSGYVTHTLLDRFNRLWLLTNSDGVKKLSFNSQPFYYYGTANRETNFIRSIYFDNQKGVLLAGTYGSGLLLFDTLGQLVKHLPKIGSENTVLSIAPMQGDDYLLLTMGSQGFYQFNAKTFSIKQLDIGKENRASYHASYYGGLFRLAPGRYLFADHQPIVFSVRRGALADIEFVRPKLNYIYNFCVLNNGRYCFATPAGLEFTDTTFRRLHFAAFQQSIFPRCLAQDKKGHLWIGTETGLYKMNEKGALLKKYSFADGLTDEGIYAIVPAENGVYFSHNKGLSFLSAEGRFSHYTRYAGLQENEFNTKSAFLSASGQIFFGGINGITAFYPQQLAGQTERALVSITAIQVMDKPWKDTAVWNIGELNLRHDESRIALRVGVPASADNASYVYEYKMDGLEPQWLASSGTDFIRYVLPPGTYTFKVRIGNGDGSPLFEKSLRITVAAPYWQTSWFLLGALLFVLAVLAILIHRYNRKKYRKRLAQLELEHKLQLERERISRDLHDNLGAYATAIADNVERVIKNPTDEARLRNLKEAAAEIMNNLRDTIWALNKKQISAVTLSDRIKAYLQKMRDSYPATQIIFEENIAATSTLSPELALNILRIVQEAFHNAIKHSGGNTIVITINVAGQLYICIKDNGTGLSGEQSREGNGLQNMKLRAEENKLHLHIQSDKSSGTRVELFSVLQ